MIDLNFEDVIIRLSRIKEEGRRWLFRDLTDEIRETGAIDERAFVLVRNQRLKRFDEPSQYNVEE